MYNFAVIRTFWRSRHPSGRSIHTQAQSGFTLIEVLVVTLLIGVIAAIAAPGWLGFTQQRRVTAANDAVLRALQQAQSQAKTRKLSYSVSLRIPNGGVPQFAVYQTKQPNGTFVDAKNLSSSIWTNLVPSLAPGQIWLGTNVDPNNNANVGNYVSDRLNIVPNTSITTVTFDYTGGLPTTPGPQLSTQNQNQGIIIAVGAAVPNSNPLQAIPVTRRCVAVNTLLGSMQAGRVDSGSVDSCKPIQ